METANRVRLFTRNGHDWSSRYPWIVESALRNRHKQFVIDREAVILGLQCLSLASARRGGSALRLRHPGARRRGPAQPSAVHAQAKSGAAATRPAGIFVAPFEQGEIGPHLFRAACNMGLEGMVSKRGRPTLSGQTIQRLGEGKEPQTPRIQPSAGSVLRCGRRCLRRS